MFMRRDLATIACYVLIFGLVVLWAALEHPGSAGDRQDHLKTRAALISDQLAPGQEEPEVRHLAQRMLAR